jgi:energy-coupling factor transport system permease protein
VIRDITIGQYLPGDSVLHRLDARMKTALTFLFVIMIFFCKNFLSLGLVAVFTLLLTVLSKVPFRMMIKSLKPIFIILVFTAVLNILYTGGGRELFGFWKISITDKGLYTAGFMVIRIICLITGSSLLTYTTTPTHLTDAIERLLSPLKLFKIQVNTLAMMMTLALRFIPTLIEEIDRIMNAQKARGADLESGGVIKRAKALIPILIPLFISAFRRAYELAFAMECRCYHGGDGRTRMKQMKLSARDFAAAFCVALLFGGIIFLNYKFKALI